MAIEDLSNREDGLNKSPEDQILDLLDTVEGATDDVEDADPEETEEEESEDNLEEEAEEDDLEEESEEDDELEEDADDQEDQEEDDDKDEERFEITIGEETQEVTLTELSEGYLRQADYTKKTQALADERKEVQSTQQEVVQLRANLVSQMGAFQSADKEALAELDKIDWQELKALDPEEYLLKKTEKAELTERVEQADKDMLAVAQQQYEENVKAFEAAKVQAHEILISEQGIPGWGDEEKFPAIKEDLKQAGVALGYTEEELSMAIDPRALKALWLASKALKLEKAKPKLDVKRKKKVPKVTKPSAKRTKRNVSKQNKLKQRAAKTGRMEDAANAFLSMLDDED